MKFIPFLKKMFLKPLPPKTPQNEITQESQYDGYDIAPNTIFWPLPDEVDKIATSAKQQAANEIEKEIFQYTLGNVNINGQNLITASSILNCLYKMEIMMRKYEGNVEKNMFGMLKDLTDFVERINSKTS